MILKEPIYLDELIQESNNYWPDRIKFCLHLPTKTVSVDLFYHIDMEHELYDAVGTYNDIYGGDIMLDPVEVVWEAHPNIKRNLELGTPGNGRLLEDENLKNKLMEVLMYWIR